MIFRYPAYYDKFVCIADRCEDTCCAGWEIDIDDDSYRYYMTIEGEFGERLRSSMKEYESQGEDVYEEHGFVLKEKKRCPFLDEKNLCDLYRELGEDALCDVCTDTPRNYLEYGGQRELALSAACPEAARLIYGKEEKTTFVEKEISEELDFEETAEELALAQMVRQSRDEAIQILQNREMPLEQRICRFLRYGEEVQQRLNGTERDVPPASLSAFRLFLGRMVTFTGMESINEEWEERLKLLQETFVEPQNGEDLYMEALAHLHREIKARNREYEYEHLMVYYAFMCLPRCVDDYDFIGKAKLAVTSFLMIRDMDAVQLLKNGDYTKKDRTDTARIYAKEVEHSEKNLDYLADEFLFEETYEISNLCRAVETVRET
jgi:lysine-N-methylase